MSENNNVDKRYDFVALFDVQDGNPNGDPDAGNLPRIDPQTLQGFITDVCIKRKVRNAVAVLAGDKPGHEIYFQTQDAVYEKRVLNLIHQVAYDALGIKPGTKKSGGKGKDKGDMENIKRARDWMCENNYDVRTFGAVMSTGVNCGQVRGPVQLTFARSIDAIIPFEIAITRKSVTSERRAADQINKTDPETGKRFGAITGEFGRKNTVPYAIYRAHGFVNPYLARDTGFTYADLALFFRALQQMFEFDRSAARGLMAVRRIGVFQHDSALGNAPAHVLFEKVKTPALGPDAAPRSFDDYEDKIQVNTDDLPKGVSYRDLAAEQITEDYFPWTV
ncbi:MAG: type I-C CRISPR-associated protein Cas7/Csd2 [Planctomycetota bacterium]|nr:type I-C CRISPR-associated protein Cas7/Csd2 [Planctomycetota bacterium]